MKLKKKLRNALAYTFAFGLVSFSLLTRKTHAVDLKPQPVTSQLIPTKELATPKLVSVAITPVKLVDVVITPVKPLE